MHACPILIVVISRLGMSTKGPSLNLAPDATTSSLLPETHQRSAAHLFDLSLMMIFLLLRSRTHDLVLF